MGWVQQLELKGRMAVEAIQQQNISAFATASLAHDFLFVSAPLEGCKRFFLGLSHPLRICKDFLLFL